VGKVIELHKKGIAHNNLKLENIFTDDSFSFVYFSDLKIKKDVEKVKWSMKILIAPENYLSEDVVPSKENDIWSVGVILFELLLKNCELNIPWMFNVQNDLVIQRKIIKQCEIQEKMNKKEKFITRKENCIISEMLIEHIEQYLWVLPEKRNRLENILKCL